MSKITLAPLANLQQQTTAVNTINSNFQLVSNAIGNTLSRDGTAPNAMGSNLDMNNNQILNLPAPATINSPVRLVDVPAGTGVPIASVPPVGTSGANVGLLNGNNIYSGTSTFTNTIFSNNNPFISQANYGGSNTAIGIQGILGTVGTPSTNPDAPFIFEKTSNIVGNTQLNPTVLVTGYKNASTGVSYISALTSIAQDNVGGVTTFSEAARFMTVLAAGTLLGSAYGSVSIVGLNATSTFTYGIANEAQVVNNTAIAAPIPSSFNVNSFSSSFLASNSGTNTSDAAYVVNHYNTQPFRTGLYIGSNSIDHTCLYNAASVVNGIDLSGGTYSGFQIKGRSSNFTVDNSGNIATAAALTTGNVPTFVAFTAPIAGNTFGTGILIGSTFQSLSFGTGAPSFSAGKGSLYAQVDATTTTTRLWINTNGSTTWTAFTSLA